MRNKYEVPGKGLEHYMREININATSTQCGYPQPLVTETLLLVFFLYKETSQKQIRVDGHINRKAAS